MSISRDCYLIILCSMHFAKNPLAGNPKRDDSLYKIRPILDYFNMRLSKVYYLGRDLSIDESMILWRGRLSFRQYIKSKHNKYGIKMYMLNNPDGFINMCVVCMGSSGDMGGKGHTEKVILHLMAEKLHVGHHILATTLLNQKTLSTGTLKLNRKYTPEDVSAKLGRGERIARYSNGVMIGNWKDQ
ncbi:piggyBac transposable element-derived protein 4-like [Schistocerca americana]|uniref:piggyBac transposable element-derived protein 4-like n=1 Tax=Schistocerca americana TaxID=7009 RepID=UPI001F4F36F4|nr:piggyBac transposable element-derived protein 4-like [Schistocerca americana]